MIVEGCKTAKCRLVHFRLTRYRLFFGIAFAAPLFVLAAAGAVSAVRIARAHSTVAGWMSVQGQLIAVDFRPGEDPHVEYTYVVHGIRYHGHTFSMARCHTGDYWARMQIENLTAKLGQLGGTVVYYEPAHPHRSCLYRENAPVWINLLGSIISSVMGLLIVVAALLDVRPRRNHARLSATGE